MRCLAFILLGLFCALSPPSRAQSPGEEIQARFTNFQTSFPQEKVFLHLDRPSYLLGESIWFRAYLAEAQAHYPSPLSDVLYVELIDPQDSVWVRHHLKIVAGAGRGDFTLPLEAEPGNYRVRAYTQYMRNYAEGYFFEQVIPVYAPVSEGVRRQISSPLSSNTDLPLAKRSIPAGPTVLFYPEGGDLIAGLQGKIGFTAHDESGNPIQIRGRILNPAGDSVNSFSTVLPGYGSFNMLPLAETKYSAEVKAGERTFRVDLPSVKRYGQSIQLATQGQDLILTLQSNLPKGLKGATLLGHLRGQVFCRVENLEGPQRRLRIPSAGFPEGIAHFTLFDEKSRPVAERLAFIHQPSSRPKLSIDMAKTSWKAEEMIEVELGLHAANGSEQSGTASLSVFDSTFLAWTPHVQDIQSYLLLNSDLPHPLQDAQSFFRDLSPASQSELDLILLTQGWRRFTWSDVLEKGEPDLHFPNESGISFGGRITKSGLSGKPVAAEVIVMGLTDKLFMQRTLTEEDGLFYFSGFSFEDSINLSFQAGTYQAKKGSKRDPGAEQISLQPTGNRNVDIELFDYRWPTVSPLPVKPQPELREQVLSFVQGDSTWSANWEARYDKIKEISLEEVVIEGKKTEPVFTRFDRKDILYGQPDTRLILDSIPSAGSARTIFDVIRARSPGVEILGPPGEKIVRIRGQSSINLANQALFLLDGAPVSTITANNLDIQRVDYIDIVRGLRATSIYGEAANGGIVAIFTKAAYEPYEGSEAQEPGVLRISHPGYYQAREFYAPPKTKEKTSPSPELRSTLYWESDLTLDQHGQAKIHFTSFDQVGAYVIVVQGLSADAQPFYSVKSIHVSP